MGTVTPVVRHVNDIPVQIGIIYRRGLGWAGNLTGVVQTERHATIYHSKSDFNLKLFLLQLDWERRHMN